MVNIQEFLNYIHGSEKSIIRHPEWWEKEKRNVFWTIPISDIENKNRSIGIIFVGLYVYN